MIYIEKKIYKKIIKAKHYTYSVYWLYSIVPIFIIKKEY